MDRISFALGAEFCAERRAGMSKILCGVGLAAIMMGLSGIAHAQNEPASVEEVPAPDDTQVQTDAEIIVSGTNIVRNGYKAPTPTTVVDVEKLQELPRVDLADTLNILPVFRGSTQPQTGVGNLNGGFGGVNALNMRGLGVNRTLTLLDGMRSVAATADGQVDVSEFPQELVQRVDVVTGGASAAYGSDAVTGVVNFILDKKFTGLKGELSGGMTRYGDDENIKGSLSGGFGFDDSRGHVLVSAEASYRDGILYATNREWMKRAFANVQNPAYTPTNGLPEFINAENVNLSRYVPGGLIISGPLRGIAFGPNGTTRNFVYGPTVGINNVMIGGEENWNDVKVGTLDPRGSRQSFFGRISYDVTDNINVFLQAQYAHSTNLSGLAWAFRDLTIQRDNAFLPPEVVTSMTSAGVTNVPFAATFFDLHTDPTIDQFGARNKRELQRYVVGASGTLDALGTPWSWNISYQKGITHTDERVTNNFNVFRLGQASDAVRVTAANVGTSGLAIGTIGCRINVDANTTNNDATCVPYNPFGFAENSTAAINWLVGQSQRQQKLQLDDFRVTINGEPFDTWAGPVTIATGFEHRNEKVSGVVDATSAAGRWLTSNYVPANGSYKVTEGFVEAVAPLAKDVPFAQLLEVNGAVRYAHYSNFGNATTWKIGATYEPIEDIRFRATYSKDLRAPNLGELFGGSTSASPGTRDPFLGNITYPAPSLNIANPNLGPETGHTFGFGAVLQPRFIPGFSLSVDYWKIKLDNGVAVLGGQNIIDFCFASGDPFICGLITRSPTALPGEAVGRITQVRNQGVNLAQLQRRGIDIEMSYRLPIDNLLGSSGSLEFRGFATRYLEAYTDNGVTPATDALGADPAKWIYNASVSLDIDPVRLSMTGYGFSSGVWNTTNIECTTGCPTSTALNRTVADNNRPGAFFVDLTADYEFRPDWHFFASVQNLFNKDPVPVKGTTNESGGIPNVDGRWSGLGQTFRVGVRFKI